MGHIPCVRRSEHNRRYWMLTGYSPDTKRVVPMVLGLVVTVLMQAGVDLL